MDTTDTLYNVRTETAGNVLQNAIDACARYDLKVRLSTAIDKNDAHAIDVKYHKNC